MKPSLQLRLSQHLALTPQLQQSIRLLQLSTLELQQEVEQALTENPLLERENDWIESPLRVAADGSVNVQSAPAPAPAEPQGNGDARAEGAADDSYGDNSSGDDYGNSDWSLDDFARRPQGDEDEKTPMQLRDAEPTLREYLMEQLTPLKISARDKGLAIFLIESLDDDGYLSASLEEICAELPEELEFDPDEVHAILTLLQSFDPAGVGARNAAECLALQLRRLTHPQRELALTIVTHHLELLAVRDYTRLKKALQVDEVALKAAHDLIRSLAPYPGHAYSRPEADFVVPDVFVRKSGSGWIAQLNPDVMPRLRINDMYAQILRGAKGETGTAGLQQKLQEARWLIKNIQQRFDTILRVSQAIVERQKNFFTHGEIAMRPLVLREIADTLGLHESTISRVTTNKYMATPMGTFELKYFFGSHVSTETGGAASSTAIRALIKQLIGAEDPRNPLSDSRIAELLGEQGFVVARRTVAKYREALKIPAVNLRKSL
ncbi:sigma N (sigma 54) factor of RNA polymerase [Cupriavidus taiwanensis]|uniref:RNA polymerase sigma-54 factor n=1 Tax=Cupriavidus taiwanensis TaxID=164546 RepID=A0A375F4J4_9BURK|nr:RNA polymerase factor sigma-54 [Cupriavidus taiwanensis]SOY86292.1 sigma N (sigma 54) factor of RNA polymerase [Cupriavidus taiwanensis]SOY89551.1 sigma N (sigma 54) factor of RNA polymerase [Cupriavidus taiwanensis]SPA28611.1 sigma N (sigma 54) factor of RNA polymerase [Cupriavidus taiwanensis]SPA47912.1 sigma N (sigma 54) factor of RNA polymerase [Cupriavidus taiwanensis]SPD63381.1 RNA polymerase, sigma 54 (sigma N) factor [Cupriavidus taiwanensis]